MLFYCTNILALPVLLIFEGVTYTRNIGFWSWMAVMDNMLSMSVMGTVFMYY